MEDDPLIRVVLVDDHQHIHDAVAILLKQTGDIHLVGQAYRGADALKLCAMLKPDLVIMDVIMPGMSGVETTQALLKQFPQLRILVFSSFREYEYIKDMLDSGAIGYLVKDALIEDLVSTIRAVYQGQMVFSPEVVQTVLAPPQDTPSPDYNLTDREQQVLQLMGSGKTNPDIAAALGISQPTVRFHTNNILLKLKVDTRSEALVLAAKSHLIE